MKLTKTQLREIIKEELLKESMHPEVLVARAENVLDDIMTDLRNDSKLSDKDNNDFKLSDKDKRLKELRDIILALGSQALEK
tara:strand:- start:243 stop:488 length:246 start_codon:yes stop_codon:yes gene_type:complete